MLCVSYSSKLEIVKIIFLLIISKAIKTKVINSDCHD